MRKHFIIKDEPIKPRVSSGRTENYTIIIILSGGIEFLGYVDHGRIFVVGPPRQMFFGTVSWRN